MTPDQIKALAEAFDKQLVSINVTGLDRQPIKGFIDARGLTERDGVDLDCLIVNLLHANDVQVWVPLYRILSVKIHANEVQPS